MFKITILLIIIASLVFYYFRNVYRKKKASKFGKTIINDIHAASELANSLTTPVLEVVGQNAFLSKRLNSIKHDIFVDHHTIHTSHQLNYRTFLLVTSYEYVDPNDNKGIESILHFNYKVVINESEDSLVFYSDNEEFMSKKIAFVKGFFRKYGITI